MQFQETNHYPFPSDAVVRVFGDPDYFVAKYRGAGAKNIQVLEAINQGGKTQVSVSRQLHMDIAVPGFARKFVPDTITVTQIDSWDQATRTGSLDIRFKGMPAVVKCEMSLADENDQAVLSLSFSVTVNVPVLGDKLAKLLGEDLKKKFEKDSLNAHRMMAEFAPRYL